MADQTETPPSGTATPDSYTWSGGLTGSWDAASNWTDATTGAEPAAVAPGANDLVTIAGPISGSILSVTGVGDAASLALSGSVDLEGAVTAGKVSVATYGDVTVQAGASLDATGPLSLSGFLIATGGVITAGATSVPAFNLPFTEIEASANGTITLSSVTVGASSNLGFSATTGGQISMTSLSASPQSGVNLSVDGTSSIEVGGSTNLTAGEIVIDAGQTITAGSFNAPQLINNGTIEVAASASVYGTISGSGRLDIDANATLYLEGVGGGVTSAASGSTSPARGQR